MCDAALKVDQNSYTLIVYSHAYLEYGLLGLIAYVCVLGRSFSHLIRVLVRAMTSILTHVRSTTMSFAHPKPKVGCSDFNSAGDKMLFSGIKVDGCCRRGEA